MSFSTVHLGILGGGQLGKMLIQEAISLNLTISVLDPDIDAPCKDICTYFQVGVLSDFDTVYNFGKKVDVLTIEIEHVNVAALEQLEREGTLVFPPPSLIKIVQDKGVQKQFYIDNQIPTAPFIITKNKQEAINYFTTTNKPLIQKLCKGGYDGKGVTKLTHTDDFDSLFDAPCVIENLIPFEKEIAIIVARNVKGEIATYDAVEMEFNGEQNLVELLFAPANISADMASKAKEIAIKIAQSANLVGILAIEFFVTPSGELLVNEMAPRPHNSGHHTIECCYASQYAQLLRAILNLPLGCPNLIIPGAMINLLGEPSYSGNAIYEGLEEALKINGLTVHLYGKKQTKPYRKMGHITVVNTQLTIALQQIKLAKNMVKIVSKNKIQ